jgi:hypothetical protein
LSEEISSKGIRGADASLFWEGGERQYEGEHAYQPTYFIQASCGKCGVRLPLAMGKVRCVNMNCGALNDITRFIGTVK